MGRVADGGVDAIGKLDVSNLAKIKLFVQVKRYKPGVSLSANILNIPSNRQGAFITTCDFQEAVKELSLETGFPLMDLINAH